MPTYLVASITVDDPETYSRYTQGTPEAIRRHGGRFLVRGGEVTVKEGEPALDRVVVVEFPDRESFERFYESPEYKDLRVIRQSASRGWLVGVEGVTDDGTK